MKNDIDIDLLEGRLKFRGQTVELTRRLAQFADILLSAMPDTVAHETIAARMWGDKEIDVFGNTKVAASHLRKRLRPLGLNVVVNWGRGYRLEVMLAASETERTSGFSTVTGADYAQA